MEQVIQDLQTLPERSLPNIDSEFVARLQDLTFSPKDANRALTLAAGAGLASSVQFLLGHSTRVRKGLREAARHGHAEVLQVLLEYGRTNAKGAKGADPRRRKHQAVRLAVHSAARLKRTDAIRVLLQDERVNPIVAFKVARTLPYKPSYVLLLRDPRVFLRFAYDEFGPGSSKNEEERSKWRRLFRPHSLYLNEFKRKRERKGLTRKEEYMLAQMIRDMRDEIEMYPAEDKVHTNSLLQPFEDVECKKAYRSIRHRPGQQKLALETRILVHVEHQKEQRRKQNKEQQQQKKREARQKREARRAQQKREREERAKRKEQARLARIAAQKAKQSNRKRNRE